VSYPFINRQKQMSLSAGCGLSSSPPLRVARGGGLEWEHAEVLHNHKERFLPAVEMTKVCDY
jgi:hypothetical protein